MSYRTAVARSCTSFYFPLFLCFAVVCPRPRLLCLLLSTPSSVTFYLPISSFSPRRSIFSLLFSFPFFLLLLSLVLSRSIFFSFLSFFLVLSCSLSTLLSSSSFFGLIAFPNHNLTPNQLPSLCSEEVEAELVGFMEEEARSLFMTWYA